VSLEGELQIGLQLSARRVAQVRIRSTRPDVARSLLQGRRRADVLAAVPRLFSICGHSQSVVSALACAAAAGETASPALLARGSSTVSAEVVREGAWRILLDWPRWLAEPPGDAAIAAARGALAWRAATPGDGASTGAPALAQAIAVAAFGTSAGDWLALDSEARIDRWMDTGPTAAARFMRRVRDDDAAALDGDERSTQAAPLLAATPDATWLAELAQAGDAEPAFAQQPTWHGAPAETGALARQQQDPLVAALLRRSATRIPARFMARLRELALLLAGRAAPAAGALALAPGTGIAWVENARGLLVHQVRLDGDRVAAYRIVAPTEWNFHPAGVLARSLTGRNAGDPDQVKARANVLVHALDPCVACKIEIEHA
jgi:hypothetical protein